MLSKCANPACSRQFMRLHEGKLFYLNPTPQVEEAVEGFARSCFERFWLCDECCKTLTLVMGGTRVKLVPLPKEKISNSSSPRATKEGHEKEKDHLDLVVAK